MSLYVYKAMTSQGRIAKGHLHAVNELDLENRLKQQGLDLLDASTSQTKLSFTRHKLSRQELIHFCFHLELLCQSGIPLLDALQDLRDNTEHAQLRSVCTDIITGIEGGLSLSQAMAEHPRFFPAVVTNLVRAGEYTGHLPEIFSKLGANLKWEDELSKRSQRVLIYPLLVGLLIIISFSISLTVVVPQLQQLFMQSKQSLPLSTEILIWLSSVAQHYGWACLMGLLGSALGLYWRYQSSNTWKQHGDGLLLRLPLLGNIIQKLVLCRFVGLFALMYASGIAIVDALRLCEGVVGNEAVKTELEKARAEIAQGRSLAQSFAETKLFPALVLRMLRIGEHSGRLDQAMEYAAYFLDRDVKERSAHLESLLGPILTISLGLLLLWVIVSVFGPLYELMGSIKV